MNTVYYGAIYVELGGNGEKTKSVKKSILKELNGEGQKMTSNFLLFRDNKRTVLGWFYWQQIETGFDKGWKM